jgi:ABC-type uncharacterized transport system permease subunit
MAFDQLEGDAPPTALSSALGALAIHLQYARCAFQRRAAYRLANWSGTLVNLAFFVIHAEVIRAFYGARRELGGWSADDAVVYYAISQSLIMVVTLFHDRLEPLMDRIRSGDIVLDLARPLALYPRYVAERFGNGLYFLISRAVVVCSAGLALYRVAPPIGPHLWLVPISLALAIAVSASLWYLANASAFFTEYAKGAVRSLMFALVLFGGLEIPLAFLPNWLQLVCNALPFRAAFYTPIALATGQLHGQALVFGLGHQLGWLIALALAARSLEARGIRRLVAQGG